MTRFLARDALTIVVDGEFVPGIIVYGLAERGEGRRFDFSPGIWPAVATAGVYVLHGDAWQVGLWEIPIVNWPDSTTFASYASAALAAMIDVGCLVAWIGAEGVPFCDPPGLFDPDCMSGGVLAWMTRDGDFACPLDPNSPLQPVSDDDIRNLRAFAKALAEGH